MAKQGIKGIIHIMGWILKGMAWVLVHTLKLALAVCVKASQIAFIVEQNLKFCSRSSAKTLQKKEDVYDKKEIEKGNGSGNGCPCAKGSHTVVFLPGNFGGKNDGDTQEV